MLSRIWSSVGSEEFSFSNASSKSDGRVTFSRALKLGTLICGAVISPNGLTLLMASIADWMTELADEISFWIEVLNEENVLVKNELI